MGTELELIKMNEVDKAKADAARYLTQVKELTARIEILEAMAPWQSMHIEKGDILIVRAPPNAPQDVIARAARYLSRGATKGVMVMVLPYEWTPYLAKSTVIEEIE